MHLDLLGEPAYVPRQREVKLAGEMVGVGNAYQQHSVETAAMVQRLLRIRAISFDGDMTLWDFDTAMRRALSHALTELRAKFPGKRTAELSVDCLIAIRDSAARELPNTTTHEQIRLEAFIRTVRYISENDDKKYAAFLNNLYLKHRFEGIKIYRDVVPTLGVLGQHYLIGLMSNGNTYPEKCGLPDRFQFVVLSQDVGAKKPDPAIFRTACEEAGCRPDELMHVGDSLDSDVCGANAIGAVSVWLNRASRPNRSDIRPDYEIHSLADLSSFLRFETKGQSPPNSECVGEAGRPQPCLPATPQERENLRRPLGRLLKRRPVAELLKSAKSEAAIRLCR